MSTFVPSIDASELHHQLEDERTLLWWRGVWSENLRKGTNHVKLRQMLIVRRPGVYGLRELEQIRVGEVDLCGGDGKDNTGLV
jgi:hypothetical protein